MTLGTQVVTSWPFKVFTSLQGHHPFAGVRWALGMECVGAGPGVQKRWYAPVGATGPSCCSPGAPQGSMRIGIPDTSPRLALVGAIELTAGGVRATGL